MDPPSPAAATAPGRPLLSAAFLGLLATQFLTALNDNIFRWLVIGISKQHAPGYVEIMLMAGTACFVLPYLVLAAPAGYMADRFSKRTVIIACKAAEIVIMALGVGAILLGGLSTPVALALLFATVALMGAQSALFSPARAASIPEILSSEVISKANGLFNLATVVATVLGMVIGNWLADATAPRGVHETWLSAAVLIGVAVLGTLTSLFVAWRPPADPNRKFPWDAPQQTFRDLRLLASNLPLLRVALGVAFFYAVGALAQLNIDQLVADGGPAQAAVAGTEAAAASPGAAAASESAKSPLLLALVAGVCLGSVLAGLWSGDRVELGIVPLGALGVAVSSLLLFTVPQQILTHDLLSATAGGNGGFVWAGVLLFLLGTSAGLFNVPLEAYLQHRSPRAARGSILAASNFLTFSGICVAALVFALLRLSIRGADGEITKLLTPQQIFLLTGLFTIPVLLYIVVLIPQATIRFLVWLGSSPVYRIRVLGRHHLPQVGGALLIANHITWLDGLLILLISPRAVRMVAWAPNLEGNKWIKRLADLFGTILIDPLRPKMVITALRTARDAIRNGELVGIFPEGGISRTGQVQGFRPGMMKILEGTGAPVIPIYLEGLWGSIFSFKGGKFFWKWPERLPYPVSIHFGPPIAEPQDLFQVRQALLALGVEAAKFSTKSMLPVSRLFIRQCKARLRRFKLADSTSGQLTGGEALMRALILRRLLRRVLAADEQYVGVLLPPSVPAFLANVALAFDRRITANLNYTVTSDVMNACIRQAGIRHVITSRRFMEKMNFQLEAEIVYLEDFKEQATAADKALGYVQSYCCPAWLLDRLLGLTKVNSDDTLTVIFTSGSTGTPKGVMLSYGNIGSNVAAIDQVVHLKPSDVLVGILPFFHSFGYTVTLWGVASLDIGGAYHFSPLDAQQIGKLTAKYKGTFLLSTPTFLRTYVRRCHAEDLATLDVVVCGAEKLPRDLADEFEKKFGVRPVEGYGTTELAPVVSVNIPPSRSINNFQPDRKEGSVGRPLPGIAAKVTDLDTGRELGAGHSGMLWISGPNVMQGYLHQPEKTAEVIRDGWYQTGDVAFIDEEGFIHITGRESRFSKIGGEMVPHIRIEEELERLLGPAEDGKPQVAVTAVPDPKKGERLIVLYTRLSRPIEELQKGLAEAGLPNLFIPDRDGFLEVPELPILGTGKLDLRGIKTLALERTARG